MILSEKELCVISKNLPASEIGLYTKLRSHVLLFPSERQPLLFVSMHLARPKSCTKVKLLITLSFLPSLTNLRYSQIRRLTGLSIKPEGRNTFAPLKIIPSVNKVVKSREIPFRLDHQTGHFHLGLTGFALFQIKDRE